MCKKDTALLIDGGFLRKAFEEKFNQQGQQKVHISAAQIIINAKKICDEKCLFRIYFYDAIPFDGKRKNPISKTEIDFSKTSGYNAIIQNQNTLARSPRVAFRRGHLSFKGWKYKDSFDFTKQPSEHDIIPVLEQKTVDIKIGLDIAWLSLKHIVDRIIIVTSDSDFIPVMKFARKEGLEVVLCSISSNIRKEMLEHTDEFIELNLQK